MSNTNHDTCGQILAAFIAGTAVGMATAFLIAPKSGEETRRGIKDILNSTKYNISNQLDDTKTNIKSKINEAIETTKTVAKESKRAAIEANKQVKNNLNTYENHQGEKE